MLALEEINQGQRLLGCGTPVVVLEHNRQQGFNVHDLAGVHEIIRAVGLMLLLGLLVVLLLLVKTPRGARLVTRLRLALPDLLCITRWCIAALFMLLPRLVGDVVFALDEVGALFLALTLLAYAWSLASWRSSGAVATSTRSASFSPHAGT